MPMGKPRSSLDLPVSIALSVVNEFTQTTELNKKLKILKMKNPNKEELESLKKQFAGAVMETSVAERERTQVADMYKSLYARFEKLELERANLQNENQSLKDFCKAFHYVLPEPHEDIKESVTTSTLYKTQYKMAISQYLKWFNANPQ
jgi:hypothetical protein